MAAARKILAADSLLMQLKRYFCERNDMGVTGKQLTNQLMHFLKQKISLNGPITVADYMRLTASSKLGYYSRYGNKIFGEKGDFITAPELTQVFGELIGVWCFYELTNTGHSAEWQLVEHGPGTGQLMLDITRVLKQLKDTNVSVHLVETSDFLISRQESLLCERSSEFVDGESYIRRNETKYGFPVYWYRNVDDVPAKFSVFISNEFLDALPINQFKKDSNGKWHEVYINLDKNDKLCFMYSKAENLHTLGLLPERVRQDPSATDWEICIDAGIYVNQIAESITRYGGFALIIDYGHDGTRKNFSLRAYKEHQIVNPLENPGEHDITADVNFGHLKSLIEDRTLVYGPIQQREFLTQMGIGLRLRKLLENCNSKEKREVLMKSCEMLMSEDGMGTRFKLMSVFPKTLKSILDQREGPAGFANLRSF